MDTAFHGRLERIKKLPTLPLVIRKLDQAVQDPDSDITQITGIIEDDPAIMARILKVANSVFYTTEKGISDLRTAVVVMGLRAVHNIALSTAVFSTFPPSQGTKMDRTAFWKHSIYTAIATEVLSTYAAASMENSGHHRDELHLAGLMHDIGKIVLEQFFHHEFSQALELCRNQEIPLHLAEKRILGADHAQVGAWLGEKWNLSPDIIEVIRWHHQPEDAEKPDRHLVGLCHVANHLVNMEGLGNGGDSASLSSHAAFSDIGVSAEAAPDIVEEIRRKADNSRVLLDMAEQEAPRG
ncbi:MAG: HDOD domain-containing protein [Desulfohalobiaceae bacterium]|nr:HDOD domain-containing protein [Desulfohalobiaceae bacterium]